MKKVLLLLALFFAFSASAQFTENPGKLFLSYSTDSKGLINYGAGFPYYTPDSRFDAYTYVDTVQHVMYNYETEWKSSDIYEKSTPPLSSFLFSDQQINIEESAWFNTVDSSFYDFSRKLNAWIPANGVFYSAISPVDIVATPTSSAVVYSKSFWFDLSSDSMKKWNGVAWVKNDVQTIYNTIDTAQLAGSPFVFQEGTFTYEFGQNNWFGDGLFFGNRLANNYYDFGLIEGVEAKFGSIDWAMNGVANEINWSINSGGFQTAFAADATKFDLLVNNNGESSRLRILNNEMQLITDPNSKGLTYPEQNEIDFTDATLATRKFVVDSLVNQSVDSTIFATKWYVDTQTDFDLGAVIYISDDYGNDATGTRGRRQKAFKTIGAGYTAAQTGDLVYVVKGTYNQSVNLGTKDLNWFFEPATIAYNMYWDFLSHPDSIEYTTVVQGGNFKPLGGKAVFATHVGKNVIWDGESNISSAPYDPICDLRQGSFSGRCQYADCGGIYILDIADTGEMRNGFLDVVEMRSHGNGVADGTSLCAVQWSKQTENATININVDTYKDYGEGNLFYMFGGADSVTVNFVINNYVDESASSRGLVRFGNNGSGTFLNKFNLNIEIKRGVTNNYLFNAFEYNTNVNNSDATILFKTDKMYLKSKFFNANKVLSDFLTLKLEGEFICEDGFYRNTGAQGFNLDVSGEIVNSSVTESIFSFNSSTGNIKLHDLTLNQSTVGAIISTNALTIKHSNLYDENVIILDPDITFTEENKY